MCLLLPLSAVLILAAVRTKHLWLSHIVMVSRQLWLSKSFMFQTDLDLFRPPGCLKQACGLCSASVCCLLYLFIFNYSCLTNDDDGPSVL